MKKITAALAHVGAVGLAVATAAPAFADEPVRGGTLSYAVDAEPPNYDCQGTTTFAMMQTVGPHYSRLLRVDPENFPKFQGDLAESWEVSQDQLTYTFHLRKGVKFHDGSDLTAEDVKATFDRI